MMVRLYKRDRACESVTHYYGKKSLNIIQFDLKTKRMFLVFFSLSKVQSVLVLSF